MLKQHFPLAVLEAQLVPRDRHCPFPAAADRAAWEGLLSTPLQRERRAWAIGQAEMVMDQPWPELPASRYMDFIRNGDRSRYQTPYFARRHRLGQLAVAECFEHRGRFLDAIADGLWLLLGEPTWCLPAHAPHLPGDPLPDPDGRQIDLFCCETAFTVAEIVYVLGAELRELSPSLTNRLVKAVDERVWVPVEALGESSAWWFSGHNNWTPWCASNVLGAACYLLDDLPRLARLADLLNLAVDRFIDGYGDDGGCDEGPMYWTRAAGALCDYLTRLEDRLAGEMPLFKHLKIKAMGEYFDTAHLHEEWMLNFADAPARGRGRPALVYEFGRRVGSQSMMDLARLTLCGFQAGGQPDFRLPGGSGDYLHACLQTLFRLPVEGPAKPLRKPLTRWLPDVQVAVLRQSPDTGTGLILGAKGGHNAESHNHNDVGHFVVMLDGQPGLVDVGTATYTRATFSPQRYGIWYIRGSAHNAPVIGGIEQPAGREWAAREVVFAEQGQRATLRLELAGAYPAEAGLESLVRELVFDREAERIEVTDSFRFSGPPMRIELHFYTPRAVAVEGHVLRLDCSPRPLLIEAEAGFAIAVERVALEDPQTRGHWGEYLHRIDLSLTPGAAAGAYRLTIRPGDRA